MIRVPREFFKSPFKQFTEIGLVAAYCDREKKMKDETALIKFNKFFYDEGDKKVFGKLDFEAQTPLGILAVKGVVNHHNEFEMGSMTLNGTDIAIISDFDPGLKHFTSRDTSINEKEKVLEAINEWMKPIY